MYGKHTRESQKRENNMVNTKETDCLPVLPSIEKCLPEGRGVRRRRQFQSEASCCPVCGVTVRASELHAHLDHEVEKLGRLGTKHRRLSETPSPPACDHRDTYLKIKANRTSRIRVKKLKPNQAKCPVCNVCIRGSFEELSRHVENCLRVQDEEVNVDGEGNSFAEYEWAGQERVRASSLLDGGYAAAGMSTVNRSNQVDDDSDLVVDEDDTATYGPSQYTEADLKPTAAEGSLEETERVALRDAVIRASTSLAVSHVNAVDSIMHKNISVHTDPKLMEHNKVFSDGNSLLVSNVSGHLEDDISHKVLHSGVATSSKFVATDQIAKTMEVTTCCSTAGVTDCIGSTKKETNNIVFEALKSRINELEKMIPVKCLICLGCYVQPVISVNCWHVYCEECWLHSLGTKKLCPMCNTITSPSDLRKIYI